MKTEQAFLEDAKEILDLQKLAYQSEAAIYDDFAIPPLTQTLDQIRKDFDRWFFLKVYFDGKIIGSVRAVMKEGTCHIGRLIVHPDFQGRGVGTLLMKEIETRFGRAERFELFTGSRSERNLRFYRELGYCPFASEAATDRLTLIFLEKRLTSTNIGTPDHP
ncbi:MAG: GNAT family N-acetyltransferase [Syntrophobacter sp.]